MLKYLRDVFSLLTINSKTCQFLLLILITNLLNLPYQWEHFSQWQQFAFLSNPSCLLFIRLPIHLSMLFGTYSICSDSLVFPTSREKLLPAQHEYVPSRAFSRSQLSCKEFPSCFQLATNFSHHECLSNFVRYILISSEIHLLFYFTECSHTVKQSANFPC